MLNPDQILTHRLTIWQLLKREAKASWSPPGGECSDWLVWQHYENHVSHSVDQDVQFIITDWEILSSSIQH